MAFKWRAKNVLAKVGETYGTDSVPTGDDNTILPINVDFTALAAQEIERGIELPWLGSNGKILVSPNIGLTFDTEITGGGTPLGSPPPWNVLARAAGFAETITATTKVEYNPITNGNEWADFYFYMSNNWHKALGARGSWKINLTANALPVISWNFMGLYQSVTGGTTPPALTTTGWKVPLPASKTNTPVFTLGGYSCVAKSLTIDSGNDVQYRGLIGSESVEIVDRNVTGEIVIESPDVATKNFFDLAIQRTRGALAVTHGTVSGNIVQIAAPAVEVGAPKYSQDQGIVMLTVPLTFVPQNGNDELKLTCI
jgi:hypothetical protein